MFYEVKIKYCSFTFECCRKKEGNGKGQVVKKVCYL